MTRRKTKQIFQTIAGKICEIVIPIPLSYEMGNGKTLAICTLSDMSLLGEIISCKDIMQKIFLVGRLLSENRGIDKILHTFYNSPQLKCLILCGRDVKGHLPGQAMISLHVFGIEDGGHIIGARGNSPILKSTKEEITYFRTNVEIMNLIDSRDIRQIKLLIDKLIGE